MAAGEQDLAQLWIQGQVGIYSQQSVGGWKITKRGGHGRFLPWARIKDGAWGIRADVKGEEILTKPTLQNSLPRLGWASQTQDGGLRQRLSQERLRGTWLKFDQGQSPCQGSGVQSCRDEDGKSITTWTSCDFCKNYKVWGYFSYSSMYVQEILIFKCNSFCISIHGNTMEP